MKKLKTWFVIKPYKCFISIGLFSVSVIARMVSKTIIFENNVYVNIIIKLLLKNQIWLIIIALLFLGLFYVENKLAKKISCEEGDDCD